MLSSTEAKYVAVSEVCTEILFIKQVLEFLGVKIAYPIFVNVDNVGAIYLAKNVTMGQHTKHIDVCHHFVRKYIEDGVVKIVFVRSEDNMADPFMKNWKQQIFNQHALKHLVRGNDFAGINKDSGIMKQGGCVENETRKVMFKNSKIETKGSEIENNDSKFETEEWTEVHCRRKKRTNHNYKNYQKQKTLTEFYHLCYWIYPRKQEALNMDEVERKQISERFKQAHGLSIVLD